MIIKTLPSKTSQLTNFLRDEITSGKLPAGTRLATQRVLAEQFQVSKKIVETAFDTLETEKLVVRKARSGVFVAEPPEIRSKTIAFFTETTGHVYEKQTNRLVTEFQKRGYMTLVINIDEYIRNKGQQSTILENLLQRGLDGLIIDGVGDFPYKLLKKHQRSLSRLAFINRFECDLSFEALKVISAPQQGIYSATKHLLNSGREKVMLITTDPVNFAKTPYYPFSQHLGSLNGYRQALQGTGKEELIFYINNKNNSDLEKILNSSKRPDGIVSYGDFRAKQAMDICRKLTIRIPRDIAMVGYYNTPWAEMLATPLTSVSIKEELIAKTVVERLCSAQYYPEEVVITPEIVIRDSCGTKEYANAV